MKALVIALLCLPGLPALCSAESAFGSGPAAAHLNFRIVVPPVFRVLQVTPVPGGTEYRVWTNMRAVFFQDRLHRFRTVGESVLKVAASSDLLIVHGL